MLGKYKNIIIAIVVIILLFFVYNQFFGPNSSDTRSLLKTTAKVDSAEVLGADIIKAINQISSLELDKSVFEDPVFTSLIDRSEELDEEPKGRNNPFAPIGEIDPVVEEDGEGEAVE